MSDFFDTLYTSLNPNATPNEMKQKELYSSTAKKNKEKTEKEKYEESSAVPVAQLKKVYKAELAEAQQVLENCIVKSKANRSFGHLIGNDFHPKLHWAHFEGPFAIVSDCPSTAGFVMTNNYNKIFMNIDYLSTGYQGYIIRSVVPHEYAHTLCNYLWPDITAHRNIDEYPDEDVWMKEMAHGPLWQSVMRTLGAAPDQFHDFDLD